MLLLSYLYRVFLIIRFPTSAKTKGLPFKDGLKMVRDPMLLLFGFILFFQSGIEGLTNNWTTTYLETFKKVEASTALFILSSFVGALTIARIVLGKFLRIFNPLKVLFLSFTIAIVGSFYLIYGHSYLHLITGMVAIGFGLAAGFPVILGYVGQLYKHLSGTAFGIVITIALIGNVIANYTMGIVSQQYGIEVLPYLILLAILAELLMLYFTKKKYNNKLN